MKSIIEKIKKRIDSITDDEFPKYPPIDKERYSFNKEILLREISSFKWVVFFILSMFISMFISLINPITNYSSFNEELFHFKDITSQSIYNEMCEFPEHPNRFQNDYGFSQFYKPFKEAIDDYKFKTLEYKIYTKNEQNSSFLFTNYPTKNCKKSNKEFNRYEVNTINFSQARLKLENQVWDVKIASSVFIDSIDKRLVKKLEKYPNYNFLELCNITFSEDSKTWIAKIEISPDSCETNNYKINGGVNWEEIKTGPFIQNFKLNYPKLLYAWRNLYNHKVNEKFEKAQKVYFSTYDVKFFLPSFNHVNLVLSNFYFITYISFQFLLITLFNIKLKNLKLKSFSFSIPLQEYMSKWYKIPIIFLLIVISSLNNSALLFLNLLQNKSHLWTLLFLFPLWVYSILSFKSLARKNRNSKKPPCNSASPL